MCPSQPLLSTPSSLAATPSPKARYQPVVWTTLLTLLLGLLYWRILRDLGAQWWDDANYSHGFIVPLFSGFLVWRDRSRLRTSVSQGSGWGLLVLMAGVGLLVLGDLGAENFLSRSSLIVTLAGLVLYMLGANAFRIILFPLGFLLFMVPLPGILFYAVTFPLQQFAATQAAWTLDALGVPVLLDGNIIHLSQISLGVTEACSGIRSLISLMAGAVAWAYLLLPGWWPMTIFVAAAVPITILANVARVVATGLIGQWFGVEYASGFFHEMAGLFIYLVAFLGLVGLHGLIQWTRRPKPHRGA